MKDNELNEPAFPKAGLDPWAKAVEVQAGMSLRDYFAAKAMDSLIAGAVRGHIDYGNEGDVARRAYEFADAMLKARAQSTPTAGKES